MQKRAVCIVRGKTSIAHLAEELLMGKDHSVATQQFLHANSIGRLLFAHKLNIYLMSVQETQLRLYDELERVLREFLSAVRILSKGYLPASLFPPTILRRITSNALQMVQKKNPNYVLTIKHFTEYYDMKMVTFGVNDGEELVVAFPVFVQDHTRESMTLYELETVKVPITDTNLAANSYTEVETSKPYIAFNNDYYIQLRIPELCMCKQIWHSYYCEVMCKQIWHSYYCEELFLVKHKSKHSCESAIYYNLSKEVTNEYCSFKYFYNTTIMPSVLDGGPQILLANILTPKRLICTYASDVACPAPPRYVRAEESSEDEEVGQDEEEDLEAPYLAPKSALSSGPAQSEESAQIPAAGDQTPAKDLSDSGLLESIPELIDLREEGERPSPFPSQKAQRPTMLKLPILYSSPPEGQKGNGQEATIGVCQEKAPKEQIIFIDDDRDPSPLQLLERQVDSLLMPPPADSAPKAWKTYRSPDRGFQLSRMPEDEE